MFQPTTVTQFTSFRPKESWCYDCNSIFYNLPLTGKINDNLWYILDANRTLTSTHMHAPLSIYISCLTLTPSMITPILLLTNVPFLVYFTHLLKLVVFCSIYSSSQCASAIFAVSISPCFQQSAFAAVSLSNQSPANHQHYIRSVTVSQFQALSAILASCYYHTTLV